MVRLIASLWNDLTTFYAEYHRALMTRISSPSFVPGVVITPTPSWGPFTITPNVLYTIFAAGIFCDTYFALFSPDDPTIRLLYSNNRELKIYTIPYTDLGRLCDADPQFYDMDCVSESCFSSEFAAFCDTSALLFTADRYMVILA